MRFEIIEYDNEYMDSPTIGYRGAQRMNPNGLIVEADRYDIRNLGEFGTTVVSFFRGDNEIVTLFRLPRMIRVLDQEG